MAKILTFRNASDKASGTEFLTDESQTLSFDTAENGSASLGDASQAAMQSLFPDHKKDWSNQELADLFRVHQLLNKANVPVDTDRGITDEGDPWFVFCYASGEVFIHLCRIDGLYLLDSPNVLRPLRGANFNELISDFTNQTLPAPSSAATSERRVIRLERGGKISLHPSAMLAALIWTLLMASEDLVLLAPEEIAADDTDTDSDALLNFDGMFAVEDTTDPVEGDVILHDTPEHATVAKDTGLETAHLAPETHGQMREVMQQQGMAGHQNAFAAGLSTIAIAMGFMSEAALFNNQHKVLENLNALGFSEYGEAVQATATLDITEADENSALLAMLADFLNMDLSLDTDMAQAAAAPEQTILQQEMSHLAGEVLTAEQTLEPVKVTPASKIHDKNFDAEVPLTLTYEAFETEEVEDVLLAMVTEETDTAKSDAGEDVKVLNLSEALQIWQQAQSAGLQSDTLTVLTSFEVSASTTADVSGVIEAPAVTQPEIVEEVVVLNTFDALSERLIEFITNKGSDIGYIQRGDGFIAVDREAVKAGDVDYKQWETDDGKFIGMIGLASDFQQLDLIA